MQASATEAAAHVDMDVWFVCVCVLVWLCDTLARFELVVWEVQFTHEKSYLQPLCPAPA